MQGCTARGARPKEQFKLHLSFSLVSNWRMKCCFSAGVHRSAWNHNSAAEGKFSTTRGSFRIGIGAADMDFERNRAFYARWRWRCLSIRVLEDEEPRGFESSTEIASTRGQRRLLTEAFARSIRSARKSPLVAASRSCGVFSKNRSWFMQV